MEQELFIPQQLHNKQTILAVVFIPIYKLNLHYSSADKQTNKYSHLRNNSSDVSASTQVI